MNEIQAILNFFETHQSTDAVLIGWLTHCWANIISNYPSIKQQGGVLRVILNFFWVPGFNQQTTKVTNNEKVNPSIASVSNQSMSSASGNGPKP